MMHPEAMSAVERFAAAFTMPGESYTALDIGGADWNGSARKCFGPLVEWTVLDNTRGDGVDIIADATRWVPFRKWDIVLCTEVFEHVYDWHKIVSTAHLALHPSGTFLVTCASTHRPEHGAQGGPLPLPGEWYQNVDPDQLRNVLKHFFRQADVEYVYPPGDAYAWATHPKGRHDTS